MARLLFNRHTQQSFACNACHQLCWFVADVRALGEALERERFQSEVVASFAAGRQFGAAKASFEATNRLAIHLSLLMLYAWGGYLVSQGMMPVGVLVSGIGFTFSLMYATQGAVNTLSELRRAAGAFDRVRAWHIARLFVRGTVCQCGSSSGGGSTNGSSQGQLCGQQQVMLPIECRPMICWCHVGARLACWHFLLLMIMRDTILVILWLCCEQVRSLIQVSDPDPSMFGALPPGAWWEVANGAEPVFEPYADKAGDAAVVAARSGDLELCNVMFAYPLRKEMAGVWRGGGGLQWNERTGVSSTDVVMVTVTAPAAAEWRPCVCTSEMLLGRQFCWHGTCLFCSCITNLAQA